MSQPSRRDALKALAAATSAVTIASLPTRWSKPTLRVGAVPAHAQVSCLAVSVELISSEGTFDFSREQGPAPTSTVGTLPEDGYMEIWACQEGCLQIDFYVDEGATVNWEVVVGGVVVPISLFDGEFENILINLSTLEFAQNYNTPPDGCSWTGGGRGG